MRINAPTSMLCVYWDEKCWMLSTCGSLPIVYSCHHCKQEENLSILFFFLKLELKIQVLPQHRHCWLSETHVQSWQLSNRGAMWSPGVLEREPGGMPKGSQRESVPSMGEQLNCPTCPFSVTCAVNRAGLGLLTFAQRSWKIFLGFLKWVWV